MESGLEKREFPSRSPDIALRVNPGRFFFMPPIGAPAFPPPVPIPSVGIASGPEEEGTREEGEEEGREKGGALFVAGEIEEAEDDRDAILGMKYQFHFSFLN